MAAGGEQSFTEEILSCTICTEIYDDPCTLSCQHSFCRKCIINYVKTQDSDTVPCALCRQVTTVSDVTGSVEEWTQQLKPSLILQNLMDRYQRDNIHKEGQDICFLCMEIGETIPAVSWCSDCEVTLCNHCKKRHQKGPSTKKHDMFDLSEGVTVKERRKVKCKEHEGELIRVICKDCNKAVCQTCCILKHAKHNIFTIETMIPEIKSVLSDKKCILQEKIAENKTHLRNQESKIRHLNNIKKRAGSEIKSAVNSAINLLREKERNFFCKLDEILNSQIDEHKARVKSCQITNQMYQQHCEFVDQALQTEYEMDMYDMYQVCLSGVVESVVDTESDNSNTPIVGEVKFTLNMGPLTKAITEMGKLDAISQREPAKLVLQDTINIKHTEEEETSDPIDVTVLNYNDEHIMIFADWENKCLKSLRVNDKSENASRLVLSYKPLAVTRITGNKIAATVDGPHIVVVEVRPTELALISTLTTSRGYSGLACLPDSTLVAGSDSPAGVDILDLSGNVLRSFTPQNTGLSIMQWPLYLSATQNGNILVSDFRSNSVYCLTSEGDVVFTYTPDEGTHGGKPHGITITNKGDIILIEGWPYKIIQLSQGGYEVGDILPSLEIGEPWGLCIDDSTHLYVCDRHTDHPCVKVFSFT